MAPDDSRPRLDALQVLAVLRRMDEAASLEDFQAIFEDITTLVQRGMLRLVGPSEPSCSAKVQGAAQRLGLGLERVLLAGAGAVPVLAATAAILDADKADKEAARAYCRCCWIMEELAPHNAYHAKWALEALLCASRASLPLEDYVAYARKVLTYHIGPGTLETVLRCQLGKKRSGALLDSSHVTHGELRMWPPGEVGITHQRRQTSNGDGEALDLQLHLDEAAPPNEVEISANQMLLYVRVRQKRVYLALPGSVVHGAQGRPVRLSKQGRRIQASFHLQPALSLTQRDSSVISGVRWHLLSFVDLLLPRFRIFSKKGYGRNERWSRSYLSLRVAGSCIGSQS